jgi:hypothetical protein
MGMAFPLAWGEGPACTGIRCTCRVRATQSPFPPDTYRSISEAMTMARVSEADQQH